MNWPLFDILSSIHQGANCSTFMKKGFIQKILEKVLKWAPKCAMIPKRKSYLAKKSFPLGSNTSWLMQMRVDCTHWVNWKKAKFGIKQPNFKVIIDSFVGLKRALFAMCAIFVSVWYSFQEISGWLLLIFVEEKTVQPDRFYRDTLTLWIQSFYEIQTKLPFIDVWHGIVTSFRQQHVPSMLCSDALWSRQLCNCLDRPAWSSLEWGGVAGCQGQARADLHQEQGGLQGVHEVAPWEGEAGLASLPSKCCKNVATWFPRLLDHRGRRRRLQRVPQPHRHEDERGAWQKWGERQYSAKR